MCIEGRGGGIKSLPISPLQLFSIKQQRFLRTSLDGVHLDSPAAVGQLTLYPRCLFETRLNVLFMTPVEHSKLLNRNQNTTPQSPQEDHFPRWNKTPLSSVTGLFRCSHYETTTLGQLNPFQRLRKDVLMRIKPPCLIKNIFLCLGSCQGWIITPLTRPQNRHACLLFLSNSLYLNTFLFFF